MKTLLKIFIVVAVLCSGCVNDNNIQKIQPLEGKLIIEPKEDYENYGFVSPPSIFIALRTEKIYGCVNYGISASLNVDRGVVEIFINGILEPEICLTASGPAVKRIKVDLTAGTYKLIIRSNDFIDEYDLTVNDAFIRLEGDSTLNTSFRYRVFHRYPEKSFVYLCGTTLKDSSLCRKFIDTVRSVIDLQSYEFPETGVIPYPLHSDGHYFDMPAQYYLYNSENDFDRIKGIMKSFKESYIKNPGTGISVTNWMNKSFYSWLL